jgi:DNA ligase-1
MLAVAGPPMDQLVYPVYASAKVDGFRGFVKDDILLTRKMKPLRNTFTQDLFGKSLLNGLDGELAVGPPNAPGLMQRCQSELSREDGEPDVTWWLFDFWTMPEMPWEERWNTLLRGYPQLREETRVKLLPQAKIENPEQLADFEQAHVDTGFEGIMVRSQLGPYKYGRSTLKEGYLLKYKRWVDAEAFIVGFEEKYHNANELQRDERGYAKRSSHQANMVPMGTLGAFLVEDAEGKPFRVSPGILTHPERQEVWDNREKYLKRCITYKTFKQTGVKDKPRFGNFRAFRNDL